MVAVECTVERPIEIRLKNEREKKEKNMLEIGKQEPSYMSEWPRNVFLKEERRRLASS